MYKNILKTIVTMTAVTLMACAGGDVGSNNDDLDQSLAAVGPSPVNTATYQAQDLAPGVLAALFDSHIRPATSETNLAGQTELQNYSIELRGGSNPQYVSMPMTYVGNGQMNFLINTFSTGSYAYRIVRRSGSVNKTVIVTGKMNLRVYAPTIFTSTGTAFGCPHGFIGPNAQTAVSPLCEAQADGTFAPVALRTTTDDGQPIHMYFYATGASNTIYQPEKEIAPNQIRPMAHFADATVAARVSQVDGQVGLQLYDVELPEAVQSGSTIFSIEHSFGTTNLVPLRFE